MENNRRCKRDKLTGIVACFINEITDYDHGGAIKLEDPNTLYADTVGLVPTVRVKRQPDNVGLHTVVNAGATPPPPPSSPKKKVSEQGKKHIIENKSIK